jgi:protein tyrosine phosphatase (PTP) superfamily phosphohydrolase (DUF442 family)
MDTASRPPSPLSAIRNFRRVDGRLATCGQPSMAQLEHIAAAGFEVVVNLGLHDDPRYALPDETGHVRSLGMAYVHIPVVFGNPTEAGLRAFMAVMDEHRERRVLVHCAANIRATAFLGLYRVIRLGWPRDLAFDLMHSVWVPDPVWTAFITAMLDKHAPSPPRVALQSPSADPYQGFV